MPATASPEEKNHFSPERRQDSPLGWKQLSCFVLELSCDEPAFCG